MLFENEDDTRTFMRRVFLPQYGFDLEWHEPGRGSQSGFPDVTIIAEQAERMPVELKHWEVTANGLYCPMRPMQRQWHMMEAIAGRKSLVIFSTNQNLVFMLNGRHVPRNERDRYNRPRVEDVAVKIYEFGKGQGDAQRFKDAMAIVCDLVENESFWI